MIAENKLLALENILVSYLDGSYKDIAAVFDSIKPHMEDVTLSPNDLSLFIKFTSIFFG